MDSGTILLLVIVGLLALAFLFLFATTRRRDTERALEYAPVEEERAPETALVPADRGGAPRSGRELEKAVALERRATPPPSVSAPPPPPAIPDEETLGVTRRQVLNRGIVTGMVLGITGFGGASLAMLWPTLTGGFGARIRAGSVEDVLGQIAQTREPFYNAAGRFYLNPYPQEAVAAAQNVPAYSAVVDGYEQGFVALYQKCVHLGCRVPWCTTSQWFECPCHGSQYNRVGEHKAGPAPRGLDRFQVSVDGGIVTVDTGLIIAGPPIGTNTTGQESEGPHCIGQVAGGH